MITQSLITSASGLVFHSDHKILFRLSFCFSLGIYLYLCWLRHKRVFEGEEISATIYLLAGISLAVVLVFMHRYCFLNFVWKMLELNEVGIYNLIFVVK